MVVESFSTTLINRCYQAIALIIATLDKSMRRISRVTARNRSEDERRGKNGTKQPCTYEAGILCKIRPRKNKSEHERIDVKYLDQDGATFR